MKENDAVYSEKKADTFSTQGWEELTLKKDVLTCKSLISLTFFVYRTFLIIEFTFTISGCENVENKIIKTLRRRLKLGVCIMDPHWY